MKRVCTKCHKEKEVTCFYVRKDRKSYRSAYRSACKSCMNKSSVNYFKMHPQIKKSPSFKMKCRRGAIRWKAKYPFKISAERKANLAVRKGILVKQPCRVCGNLMAEKHHPDYSKPLEVMWLCKTHHLALHRRAYAPQ